MVICHCRAISDCRIRSAVDGGALDLETVARYCGAGSACGGCRPAIAMLLATLTDTPVSLGVATGARPAARSRVRV